jgi:hypothetical protein
MVLSGKDRLAANATLVAPGISPVVKPKVQDVRVARKSTLSSGKVTRGNVKFKDLAEVRVGNKNNCATS